MTPGFIFKPIDVSFNGEIQNSSRVDVMARRLSLIETINRCQGHEILIQSVDLPILVSRVSLITFGDLQVFVLLFLPNHVLR